MVFPGKTAWWYWAATLACFACAFRLLWSDAVSMWAWPAAFIFAVVLLLPVVRNRVEVEADRLTVKYAAATTVVMLEDVLSVERSRSASAAQANATDRVVIRFRGADGLPDEAVVALRDNSGFMQAVEEGRRARLDGLSGDAVRSNAAAADRTGDDDASERG